MGEAVATIDAVVAATVHDRRPELISLSHRIHEFGETAFGEVRSAQACRDLLAAHGFRLQEVPGLPTAFVATAGAGPRTVAVCCEYDALPDLGHACGHNVIAAAGVGAGLALAAVAERAGVQVRVIGCPAEEEGCGKQLLLDRGVFEGCDAVAMVHGGDHDTADFESWACSTRRVSFVGRASHAVLERDEAAQPRDAALLAELALRLASGHLPAHCSLHSVVEQPGPSPTLVPERVGLVVHARAPDGPSLAQVGHRLTAAVQGAAAAAGCEVHIQRIEPDYLDMRTDPTLAQAWRRQAAALGRTVEGSRGRFAMTDFGNVSQQVPALHAIVDIADGTCSPHSPQFGAAAVAEAADRTIVDAAILLARTLIEVTDAQSAEGAAEPLQ